MYNTDDARFITVTNRAKKRIFNDPLLKMIDKELIHIASVALPRTLLVLEDPPYIERTYSKEVQSSIDTLRKHREERIKTILREEKCRY